jgi:2-amino-4-hydroxy-6-hydroxymethyldihydropteridine diphosphokinase
MILVAVGSNISQPEFGAPRAVCAAAVAAIEAGGCAITAKSRWFRSAAIPISDQPDFINGVISVETRMSPTELLVFLHRIENRFDRERSVPNAARTLDLDLLAFNEIVNEGPVSPILPHPRMTDRAFVLLPMRDIAGNWRHPVTGASLSALIEGLGGGQHCIPVDGEEVPQDV